MMQWCHNTSTLLLIRYTALHNIYTLYQYNTDHYVTGIPWSRYDYIETTTMSLATYNQSGCSKTCWHRPPSPRTVSSSPQQFRHRRSISSRLWTGGMGSTSATWDWPATRTPGRRAASWRVAEPHRCPCRHAWRRSRHPRHGKPGRRIADRCRSAFQSSPMDGRTDFLSTSSRLKYPQESVNTTRYIPLHDSYRQDSHCPSSEAGHVPMLLRIMTFHTTRMSPGHTVIPHGRCNSHITSHNISSNFVQ